MGAEHAERESDVLTLDAVRKQQRQGPCDELGLFGAAEGAERPVTLVAGLRREVFVENDIVLLELAVCFVEQGNIYLFLTAIGQADSVDIATEIGMNGSAVALLELVHHLKSGSLDLFVAREAGVAK